MVIETKQLTKVFKLYRRPSDFLMDLAGFRKLEECYAVQDISLSISQGEVVGILGRNGAGKSTLLKMIAGVMPATSGFVNVAGKVSSILELGTGFQPEYTGRENVYMGGLCLGMRKSEIEDRFEEIVEFSELRDVIDQPFRTYSSGMKARLTFSTAISRDPDILIVDEALGVGDAKFQTKCFRRILSFKEKGKSILLVSHDISAIAGFCDRAILLEKGQIFDEGNPKEICKTYQRLLFAPKKNDPGQGPVQNRNQNVQGVSDVAVEKNEIDTVFDKNDRQSDGTVNILQYGIRDANGNDTQTLSSGEQYVLYFDCLCNREVDALSCGFNVLDSKGVVLFGVTSLTQEQRIWTLQKGEFVRCEATITMWLAAGDYYVTLGVADPDSGIRFDFIEDAIPFKVLGPGGIYSTSVVNLEPEFRVTRTCENGK